MKLTNTLLLIFMIISMFAAQTLYETHQKENVTFNIYEFTEKSLVWNYTNPNTDIIGNISEYEPVNYTEIQSKRIQNLIYKAIDFIGYSFYEIAKWSMEFGYTHPQYDFELFMDLVIYYIWAIIILSLFPMVIPVVALTYLAVIGIRKLTKRGRK